MQYIIPILLTLTAACSASIPVFLSPSPQPSPTQPTTLESLSPTETPQAPIEAGNDSQAQNQAPSPTPFFTPTLPPPSDHTQYRLHATLDYTNHHLSAVQEVAYRNQFNVPLQHLMFVVEPNWEEQVFHLNSLTWGDGKPVEAWTLDRAFLRIPLEGELMPGEQLSIQLVYELNIPARQGAFGYTPRQTNLGNWYPYIPAYRPETGWLAYNRNSVGEHQSYDTADYQVELKLVNPVPDLVIAASAPSSQSGGTYSFSAEAARNFTLSLSPSYEVIRDSIDGIEVISYAFPETRAAGEGALQTTVEALAIFSELFGPYPHKSLSIVEADFPDGMEFDGFYFLSQSFYWGYRGESSNYLTILAAHETAHQWWYGLVGSNQALEPWLDESLCTYSELIFYERAHPELINWWWDFRVNFYEPELGFLDDTIYKYGSFRPYVNAIYLRGARFLQDLRDLMGEEAFFTALHAYALRHRHEETTTSDFFAIIAEYGKDNWQETAGKYFSEFGNEEN